MYTSAEEERYIKKALELAAKATGKAFPNPLVGAVVVADGEIVGEGYHRGAGFPHAEIEAISRSGERSAGGTMYLNLEPCCHFGRTPPCTSAILEAGISRVVFSIYDPDKRVRGRGAEALTAGGVEVLSGICASDALELNLPYVHRNLTGRTFVVLKLASTFDGRLTAGAGRRLTGETSREYVHYLRAWTEAVAIGMGTLEKDSPILDRRFYPVDLPPPVRMVFDTRLRFPLDHPWLVGGEDVIIYCLEGADSGRVKCLEEAGAEVKALPGAGGGVDLSSWVEDISKRGIVSVLVEGGGMVSTSLIREGLFDRLVLFYAPLISGCDGVSWYRDGDVPAWLDHGELNNVRLESFGDDIMAVYDRRRMSGYIDMVTGGNTFCSPD